VFEVFMRSALSLAVAIASLSGPGAAPSAAQSPPSDVQLIIALEDSLWATSRDRRAVAFGRYLAPDYRGVYADGVHDKAKELATLDEVEIKSYEFQDFVVRPLAPGLFAVTYRASVRGRYLEYDLRGDYWCSTIWQDRNGKWQAVLHTETKVPPD